MLFSLFPFVSLSLFALAAQWSSGEPLVQMLWMASKVIFARGTTEPAPIGIVVGPPALKAALPGKTLSFAGVNYPTSIPGFLEGGDPQGSKTMATDAKIVAVGYSQCGQLVHNSAKQLSPAVSAHINAAVIFGDPDDGQAVAGISAANTKVICHKGDDICLHGDAILLPHLTYGEDAGTAAAFIAGKVQ
ncbi:cutinase [Mycena metata]|uniref:cutinase n=1 Tax=Mycena metata TaxID=1033252 RepID=A0AAD7GZH0_9AGAR|nr:cutinase [Mycena metata]